MRVFIGIKASKNIEELVARWQSRNNSLPVRFIRPENIHLTLIPPWYVNNPSDIVIKLQSLKHNVFQITYDRVVVNSKSQVIWLESTNPPGEIFHVENLLSHLLKYNNRRPYKPHLTIARFKDGKFLQQKGFENISWGETVDNITLFESILTSKEAIYKQVYSVKF